MGQLLYAAGTALSRLGNWLSPRAAAPTVPATPRDRTDEKVAAGPRGITLPVFLPWLDNYTQETPQIRAAYREMLRDPNVKSAVLGKLLAVCALDLQVHPSAKDDAKAQQVADFHAWNLTERVAGGLPGLLLSILWGGLVDGYSVCEKVWKIQDKGPWAGKIVLHALKAKDVGNDVLLEVDEYRNVVAIRGLRYNAGEMFPVGDFVLFRHLPLFEAPGGMSDFRAVYSRYWLLDTALKLRAIGLEKRASPVVVGSYAGADQRIPLQEALAACKSSNWIAVPLGAQVEALNIAGMGDEIFHSTILDLKHDIFLGVQGAVLQALEGTVTDAHGSSAVHESTADLLKWYLATAAATCLSDQLAPDLTDPNFAGVDYPRYTLGAIDAGALAADLAIDTGMKALGYDLSKEEGYKRYGRTPPTDPDDTLAGAVAPVPGDGDGDGHANDDNRPEPFAESASHWSHVATQEASHLRVIGPTGSGKTTVALALAASVPGKLFVIDPLYTPGAWGGLPAVTVSPDGDYEPIRLALVGLLAEMKRRGRLLQQGTTQFERLTILWDEVPDTVAELPREAGLLVRRLAQRGRHGNMHLVGIGQSDRVGSWGIAGYGDAAENFATLYLGDKARQALPGVHFPTDHPAVLEWQGQRRAVDTAEVVERAGQAALAGRAFALPTANHAEDADAVPLGEAA